MNKTTISGRLGKKPELKQMESGNVLTSFSVAVKDRYGKEPITTWFNVVAWQKVAEFICKHFDKGDGIELIGRMQCRKYVHDNAEKELWQLIAEEANFPPATAKKDNGETVEAVEAVEAVEVNGNKIESSGDLPF